MIQNPFGIALILLAVEGFILFLYGDCSQRGLSPKLKKYFKFLPAVFWIYFLPMILSTLGILPAKSGLYQMISTHLLPASLCLLLVGVDLPAILKLGRPALFMMLAGSLGVMLGAPVVLILFKKWLPQDAWMGVGALSGSWIGGSANMIAVKEAIHAPDAVFLPMLAVDVIVAYSWMGILIALAGFQGVYDRWNRSDASMIEELNRKIANSDEKTFRGFRAPSFMFLLIFAAAGTFISIQIAKWLPEAKGMSAATWTILVVTALGLLMSFTPLRKLQDEGASKLGYWILYFVLASIGAKADLTYIASAPVLIAAGFVWVFIHFSFMIIVSRLAKIPMFLVATGSQANIGGPVSAPIVAAIYQPALAPVGLLLGIFGNVIGTYLGLISTELCRWAAGG